MQSQFFTRKEDSMLDKSLFSRPLTCLKVDDSSVTVRYIGLTEFKNCKDTDSEWAIIRETKTSGITNYEFPGGVKDPNFKWSDRASLFSGSSLSPSQTLDSLELSLLYDWI